MGWNVRRSSTFQPAGATPVFLPCLLRVLVPGTRLYGVSSPLVWLFRLYPLNFFTHFIYSLTSITVQNATVQKTTLQKPPCKAAV